MMDMLKALLVILRAFLALPFGFLAAVFELLAHLVSGTPVVFSAKVMRLFGGNYGLAAGPKRLQAFDDIDAAFTALRFESSKARDREHDRVEESEKAA